MLVSITLQSNLSIPVYKNMLKKSSANFIRKSKKIHIEMHKMTNSSVIMVARYTYHGQTYHLLTAKKKKIENRDDC